MASTLTLSVLTSQCLDKTVGIACLEQAITDIKESISKAGGDAVLAALMVKR